MLVSTVFHYMFRPIWPSSSVYDSSYIYFNIFKFNISIIQRSQSKILRMIVDAPWCNMFPMQHYTPIRAYHTYKMPSAQNATNITLHSKPAAQNTTGTMVQYASNATLHADPGISYVQDVIRPKCNKHHITLETFPQNTTSTMVQYFSNPIPMHIIRTRCHPPKMQQTSHCTRNPRKPAPQNTTGTMSPCLQCNTTRRCRHIIRTRCHPPKMQQTSHCTRNPLLKTLLAPWCNMLPM
jgi:hypothetical protein